MSGTLEELFEAVSAIPFTDESDEALRQVLEHADLPVLAAVLVHLTGDARWLEDPYRKAWAGLRRAVPEAPSSKVRDDLLEAALSVLRSIRDDDAMVLPAPPSSETLMEMLRIVTGDDPGPDYLPKLLEDLGLRPRPSWKVDGSRRTRFRVVVIGAGLGGLHMGAQLKQAGVDFTIIEKNAELGGTWLENTYPECGVDTPNHLYSYSHRLNPEWTRYYAKRDEILSYIRNAATADGLRDSIRFSTEVRAAHYCTKDHGWQLDVVKTDGQSESIYADVVVSAIGSLNRPKCPDIEGLDTFEGPAFHTARWRHDVDLNGKSIALIGTGSSGVQVGRSLAAVAGKLFSFQRSPHWVSPNPDTHREVTDEAKWLFRHVPYYAEWYRSNLYWAIGDKRFEYLRVDPDWQGEGISRQNEDLRRTLQEHIRNQVGGRPDLVEKLTPRYPPYTKRMVVDNGWYSTLAQAHVEVVTARIERVEPRGIVTEDGEFHPVDVIVFATGFHNTRFLFPMEVRGRSGRTIGEVSGDAEDARALLGISTPDFPNLFALNGPNSAIGHGGSGIFIAEAQVRYIMACIQRMVNEDIVEMECRQDACDSYNQRLEDGLHEMVWSQDDIGSRYRNSAGRIYATHPWTLQQFWLMTANPDWSAYDERHG